MCEDVRPSRSDIVITILFCSHLEPQTSEKNLVHCKSGPKFVPIYRGHDAAVLCVQFDDSKIVSGSCDKTIKVNKTIEVIKPG